MVNHYVHPAANPEWKDIHRKFSPLPHPQVREDAHRRTLVGVGMAATSYLFVRHADRFMRGVADGNLDLLRRMVNFKCGTNLSDSNWERLRRSQAWRRVAASSRLSMADLLNRMPVPVVQHFLGLFGASAGIGMATSSAAKSNGMPAAEGMGFLSGLAVFGAGLFAGEGRIFRPLMFDLARPSSSAIGENVCFYARRLEELPVPEESEAPRMSSLPEPATLADKALAASAALIVAGAAARLGNWLAGIFAGAESAAIPVPMLMFIPPQMSLDDLLSFDVSPEDT